MRPRVFRDVVVADSLALWAVGLDHVVLTALAVTIVVLMMCLVWFECSSDGDMYMMCEASWQKLYKRRTVSESSSFCRGGGILLSRQD